MKRIKSACLLQTVHFQIKDDIARAAAERVVREEVAHYKRSWSVTARHTKSRKKPYSPMVR